MTQKTSNIFVPFAEHNACHLCERLRAGADGTMEPCGFTKSSDATDEDMSLWLPSHSGHHTLNIDAATYLVKLVSDVFCNTVLDELQAVSWNKPNGRTLCPL